MPIWRAWRNKAAPLKGCAGASVWHMFLGNKVCKLPEVKTYALYFYGPLICKRGMEGGGMRFFHLSDLHIGLRLMNRDLREDQEYILNEIIRIAGERQPEAIVIAGDIYDKAAPAAEAVEVFDQFIEGLTAAVPRAAVMLISGNHDSAPRVDCFRGVLARQGIYMVGNPPRREDESIERVTLCDEWGPVDFYLLPFVKPSTVKQITGTDEKGNNLSYDETVRRLLARENMDPARRSVLVSHQFYLPAGKRAEDMERMDSEIRMVGNIDQVRADVLEPFDYAALGHIHKPMQVGGPACRYCGTPMACSVSEAGQAKAILEVELGRKGEEPKVTAWPLRPLREIRVLKGTLEETLKAPCDDYVSVILTDKADLDVIDMQERLRQAFPYLLEIRRETVRRADYSAPIPAQETPDPFALCCAFLKEPDEAEREILRDVLNTVAQQPDM